MSSKAWFKTTAPRLIRKFAVEEPQRPSRRSIEVWTTSCIVTNFGMKRRRRTDQPAGADCSILINPANPSLSGPHSFPYFPKGGPEPERQPQKDAHHIMGYVTQWGGMDVGDGMMFAAAVVDGMVHQLGGMRLRAECKLKGLAASARGKKDACPVGTAMETGAGGKELQAEYDRIIHTVPPFFGHHSEDDDVVELLRRCYRSSLDLAFDASANHGSRVAIPLLGAGCRGFPLDIAIQVAAEEGCRWMIKSSPSGSKISSPAILKNEGELENEQVVAFGLLEDDIALQLVNAIEESSKIRSENRQVQEQ